MPTKPICRRFFVFRNTEAWRRGSAINARPVNIQTGYAQGETCAVPTSLQEHAAGR
jgi:hypothetical protein